MSDKEKQQILTEMLKHVVFDGWTQISLEKAAESAGYEKTYAYIAFPNGVPDLVEYFMTLVDNAMSEKLESMDLTNMRIRDRIAAAVMARLEYYDQHKEAIRRLVAWHALPQNTPYATQHLSSTVSKMWYAVGDTSADFNWYTKRLLLAGVYTSTQLYWLQDTSKDYKDTSAFLSRRIEDVMKIQKAKGKLQAFAEKCEATFTQKHY